MILFKLHQCHPISWWICWMGIQSSRLCFKYNRSRQSQGKLYNFAILFPGWKQIFRGMSVDHTKSECGVESSFPNWWWVLLEFLTSWKLPDIYFSDHRLWLQKQSLFNLDRIDMERAECKNFLEAIAIPSVADLLDWIFSFSCVFYSRVFDQQQIRCSLWWHQSIVSQINN